MTHELKTWPGSFDAVIRRLKRYEIRTDDRPFAIGDTLYLREWSSGDGYTGRAVLVDVTYLTRNDWGLPPGLVVMSLSSPRTPISGPSL